MLKARSLLLLTVAIILLMPAVAAGASVGSPAVGTSAARVDLSSVAGARPYGAGWAIPVKARRPSWYTPQLAARVEATPGLAVPAPFNAPLPSTVGIRPGSWMVSPAGCTMNFIFQKGNSLGIGTAGHCVDRRGQKVVLLTLAPGRGNPVLVYIGNALVRRDGGIGDDFALVSIYPELNSWVSPTTALVGGPCGAYYGAGPETLGHYGHGLAIGTGGTPRAGVALRWTRNAYGWIGAGIFGDSGSPVRITDLKAAGNLTHLVVDTRWLPNYIAGTRISKMLSIANGWTLVNSPLCLPQARARVEAGTAGSSLRLQVGRG